jgi:hypothetical protein
MAGGPGSGGLAPTEPTRLPERPPQEELDLRVEAAQVVVGPPLDGLEDVPLDPDQEGLAVPHDTYW